jgi:hypothetical protein
MIDPTLSRNFSGVSTSTGEGMQAGTAELPQRPSGGSTKSGEKKEKQKLTQFWTTMDEEKPGSQRFIMNIAIDSKENKKPALERLEKALPPLDHPIKSRVIELIKFLESRHNGPSRIPGVSQSNDRISLRNKVARFIVRDLPGYGPDILERQTGLSGKLDVMEAGRRALE